MSAVALRVPASSGLRSTSRSVRLRRRVGTRLREKGIASCLEPRFVTHERLALVSGSRTCADDASQAVCSLGDTCSRFQGRQGKRLREGERHLLPNDPLIRRRMSQRLPNHDSSCCVLITKITDGGSVLSCFGESDLYSLTAGHSYKKKGRPFAERKRRGIASSSVVAGSEPHECTRRAREISVRICRHRHTLRGFRSP